MNFKESVETDLLASMKALDNALRILYDVNNHTGKYNKDIDDILTSKAKIKAVLNENFDACARNRQSIKN
jgi:hypothetical protein